MHQSAPTQSLNKVFKLMFSTYRQDFLQFRLMAENRSHEHLHRMVLLHAGVSEQKYVYLKFIRIKSIPEVLFCSFLGTEHINEDSS